jgi:hypothetical protein
MQMVVVKPFLWGSHFLAQGDVVEVHDKRVAELLGAGVVRMLPERSVAVESTVEVEAGVEHMVKRGPGRPRKVV